MRYYASPNVPIVREAIIQGLLGALVTPKHVITPPEGCDWIADNGAYGKGWPGDERWFAWLSRKANELCRFATAPDVVGNAEATLARSTPWFAPIRELGVPVAFVAQDGLVPDMCDWDAFDVLFLGGTTMFKLGAEARALAQAARQHRKPVHMGRVNSRQRMGYAALIGCCTADGTFLTHAPRLNLRYLTAWLVDDARSPGAALARTATMKHVRHPPRGKSPME